MLRASSLGCAREGGVGTEVRVLRYGRQRSPNFAKFRCRRDRGTLYSESARGDPSKSARIANLQCKRFENDQKCNTFKGKGSFCRPKPPSWTPILPRDAPRCPGRSKWIPFKRNLKKNRCFWHPRPRRTGPTLKINTF